MSRSTRTRPSRRWRWRGIGSGAANESQTLTVTASSSNTALIPDPTVVYTSANATGSLKYTPVADQHGSATITVTVTDNGGTANGGVDTKTRTFTVTVGPVNDAPSFTKGGDQTVNEDSGAHTVTPWATTISKGPANESGQSVDFIVSNDNTSLFSGQPAVSPSGTLTYTSAPDANGSATVTVRIHDDGGTANGGVDTSADQTFTITITAVNDEPTLNAIADGSVDEDAVEQTVALGGIGSGAANESQALTATASSSNTALIPDPTVVYTSPNASGSLKYTPVADQHGTATITVTVTDNGGTANGGDDTKTRTFTITVDSVNDEPTMNAIADESVDEDAPEQTVALGGIGPGAANESQTLTVTASSSNSALIPDPTVVYTSPNAGGSLKYTPVADQHGSATITVTISDDGGTANGGDDSKTRTFTITVDSVNDAPSFSKGGDETKLEDAGVQSVTPWATLISRGPANESGQSVDFIVSNDNNALFTTQPAVSPSGTLTYTSAPDANGSATVTVRIHDDGGTANGGVDTSADQTFTITVTAVNDAPSFTRGANQTVSEDSGVHTVTPWATSISKGPANESGQSVDFIIGNDNNSLFTTQPAVSPSGTLTYTSAPDANGSATVTVRIHDDGGTANGGVDTSADQTFTITITAVTRADPERDRRRVGERGAAEQTVAWAKSAPVRNESQALTLTASSSNTALIPDPTVVYTSPNASGSLKYTPVADQHGTATITVTVTDNGGTANGGDDSKTRTFTITVGSVNDAPVNAAPASAAVNEDGTLTFSNSPLTGLAVSDVDAGSSPIRVTLSGTNGTVTLGHPTQFGISFVAGDGTDDTTMTFEGSLAAVNAALDGTRYDPAADFYGTGALTITSNDQGATGSGGALSDSDSVVITVFPVNDQPTLNAIADETVNEDAAEQTVALGGIGSGAANESQTLTVTASSSNTALIPDPTVGYTSPNAGGSLKYTPVADQNGMATITVTVTDNGGTANGGDDTTTRTFTITVGSVNDVPSFTKGADQTVNEDSGAQTVTPWATAISKARRTSPVRPSIHRQQRQQRAVLDPAGGQSDRDADVHVGAECERLGDGDGQDPR